jgi:hypothetical protein
MNAKIEIFREDGTKLIQWAFVDIVAQTNVYYLPTEVKDEHRDEDLYGFELRLFVKPSAPVEASIGRAEEGK